MSGCGYAFLYLGTILFTRICISIGLKTNGHHQLQAKHGVLEVTVANNIHHCAITIFAKSSSSNRIIDRNRLVGINTPGSANKHTHTHTSIHIFTFIHTLYIYIIFIYYPSIVEPPFRIFTPGSPTMSDLLHFTGNRKRDVFQRQQQQR